MIEHYSNSSTSTFRRCKYKYHHFYGVKREEQGPQNIGQRTGSAGHMALKGYHLALQEERVAATASGLGSNYRFNWGKIFKKAFDWARYEFDPHDEEDMQQYNWLEQVLRSYFNSTTRDNWTVLLVEEKVKVERFMGIFDLVAEQDGKRFIVDHKFQKSEQVSHLPTDSQISFYLMLANKMDLRVDGMLYNIITTGIKRGVQKPGRIIRTYVRRTKEFLESFEEDLLMQVEEMDEFSINPKPYRNFTKDCSWDCELYNHCLQAMQRRENDTD